VSRKWKVAITTVALLACASAAFAYWTSTGSGTGDAATGSSGAITVVQTSSVAGLFPGGPAQTLSGNFNNPNAGQVFVGNGAVFEPTGPTKLTDIQDGTSNTILVATAATAVEICCE